MSYSMWGAFAETPWWIYLFFIALGFISFESTKPRLIHFKQVAVFPFLLIMLMLMMLPIVIPFTQFKAMIMGLAILPGLLFGYLQFRFSGIEAIKQTPQFYLPGSWLAFIFLAALIILKFYYYNYAITLDFTIFQQEKTSTIIVLICGFSIGIQIAKSWCFYRCMKAGPFRESAGLN